MTTLFQVIPDATPLHGNKRICNSFNIFPLGNYQEKISLIQYTKNTNKIKKKIIDSNVIHELNLVHILSTDYFSRSSLLDIDIFYFLGSGYRSNPSPIDIDYLRLPLSIV